jgi:MoaA/NifB/PqqE/SkfB family radical SAM enzyme
LSLADNLLILNKFIDYGIKKITFTGGEASLYPDLWKLVKYAHTRNIYTNLVTNARFISDDFIDNIEKYLNCITMSLDGPDSIIQKEMTRNSNHFDNVLGILEKIDKEGIIIEKKINTLVTKINIDYVVHILPILYKYKVNLWKLFQFISPRYFAKLNETHFSVSDFDFIKLREKILNANKEKSLKTIFQSKENLETSYFVVSSNGNVRYDGDKKRNIIGNLLSEDINLILNKVDFNYFDYMDRRLII